MNCFQNRRAELLKKIPERSLVILYSRNKAPIDTVMEYQYFVNNNFYYLTGISQENCILLLLKGKKNKEFLFIEATNETLEKWFGKKLTIIEASKLSLIKEVLLKAQFMPTINKILKEVDNVYIDFHKNQGNLLDLKKTLCKYTIHDAYRLIAKERLIKDEIEIKNINEAIKITNLGLKRVIKELKTARYEYEIYNAFNHEILNHGTHEIGFPSIIASGVNACCLHYPNPLDKLNRNNLILCDVGASYSHYAADITRTYPINGKFTPFQKKIYQIVLDCNKYIISIVKPNMHFKELQTRAKTFLASACYEAKLIKDKKDIINYYYHGVSHVLGLKVHDVMQEKDLILKPGMVITVEPGLYIKEKKIGVRIEDDILVTNTGSRCLSINIKKEIKDIEDLFKEVQK